MGNYAYNTALEHEMAQDSLDELRLKAEAAEKSGFRRAATNIRGVIKSRENAERDAQR